MGNTQTQGSYQSGVSAPHYPPGAASGGNPLTNVFGKPFSGSYLIPPGTIASAGTMALSVSVIGCPIYVPVSLWLTAILYNVPTAGDASQIIYSSLFRMDPGSTVCRAVLPGVEVADPIGASTGLRNLPIVPNVMLEPGRYFGLVRATSSGTFSAMTSKNITGPGPFDYAADATEATTDFSRGGIHNSMFANQLYNGAGSLPPVIQYQPSGVTSRAFAPALAFQVSNV